MSVIHNIYDGMLNLVANLGTARDKSSHTQYIDSQLNPHQLLTMYRQSWVARAGVNYPAEDSCRNWRSWRAESEQITLIEKEEKRFGLKQKTQSAMTMARLYGGAAIYINTGGGNQEKPLTQPAPIKSLIVLTPLALQPGPIVRDIDSDYFGRSEFYTLTTDARQVKIHASRLAIFYGTDPVDDAAVSSAGSAWPDSVLVACNDAINQRNSTMANVSSMVFEAVVDVMSVEGFADLLAQNQDDLLLRRAQLQAAMKGVNGMLMIDAKDSYQKTATSFASLPDVISKFQEEVAGAFGMPVTRLFGRAVAGLSGSGDGDERVYYDRIAHEQSTKLSESLTMVDECVIVGALGSRPDEVYYEWSPLRQMTDSERADIFSKTATAARSLAGNNAGEIVPLDALSDSVVNALTEMGALPGLDQAVLEYGSLAEQGLSYQQNGGEL